MHTLVKRLLAVALAACSVLSAPARASDWVFVPSAGYGLETLKFNRSTAIEDKSSFDTLDLGFTAAKNRFYVRVNTEMPLTAEYTYGPSLVRQVKRDDLGLVAGYYLRNSLSLFTGVSYGNTSIIDLKGATPTAEYTQYIDVGPFVGTNYQFNVGTKSSISISLAFALMGSSLLVHDSTGATPTDERGTTGGFSFGISWNSKIHDTGSYYLSLKSKDYNSQLETQSVRKDISILSFGFVFPM